MNCPVCEELGWIVKIEVTKNPILKYVDETYPYRCKYGHLFTKEYIKELALKQKESVSMSKVSETYKGSPYIKAQDISELPKKITIKEVSLEPIQGNSGDPVEKMVVAFKETDKLLLLNATNAKTLAEELGDESDDWVGAKISLIKTKTIFEGKNVDAVRIASAEPAKT